MNQNGLIQKTNRPVLWMMTIQLENLWHELHYTNILCCTKANAQKMLQKIFFCCIFFIKMFSLLSFNLEKNLNKRTVHKKYLTTIQKWQRQKNLYRQVGQSSHYFCPSLSAIWSFPSLMETSEIQKVAACLCECHSLLTSYMREFDEC